MALVKSASLRWGVIFLCMILGTWLGLFLQRFSATSLLFSNIVDFTVDVREIDLLMLRLPLFLLSRMFASMGAPLSAQWGNE